MSRHCCSCGMLCSCNFNDDGKCDVLDSCTEEHKHFWELQYAIPKEERQAAKVIPIGGGSAIIRTTKTEPYRAEPFHAGTTYICLGGKCAVPHKTFPVFFKAEDVERERAEHEEEIRRLKLKKASVEFGNETLKEFAKHHYEEQKKRAEAALATSQLASSKLAASEKEVKRLEEDLFQERDSVEDLTENLKEAEARVIEMKAKRLEWARRIKEWIGREIMDEETGRHYTYASISIQDLKALMEEMQNE